uniref:hypothetical protein n=1 Tax=Pararhizobium sp. IMCC3301 TaxID=3067904 RepID=UPI002742480B|nr:hypothetical protein [Pararhizobium sp. IMCC3301]
MNSRFTAWQIKDGGRADCALKWVLRRTNIICKSGLAGNWRKGQRGCNYDQRGEHQTANFQSGDWRASRISWQGLLASLMTVKYDCNMAKSHRIDSFVICPHRTGNSCNVTCHRVRMSNGLKPVWELKLSAHPDGATEIMLTAGTTTKTCKTT